MVGGRRGPVGLGTVVTDLLDLGDLRLAVGHLASSSSPVDGDSSSTISASTTSSSDSPVAPVLPPAAAASASAAAYIAAPIFWLDSPSLVIAAVSSSTLESAFSRTFLSSSRSAVTSVLTSSGIFSPLSARNFSVV